ncbi:uncharacterized protein LOC106660977 isoform X2 [Cimex lectularius]|uniref:WW domain-containing protein n=1 Tax=Cimex lectularius TaxID=79782 RepID=A0A8I6R614_CIMLE|nr:uncharacterized protein LOC106660977 isoform X2 [Cimex lectularius]
MCSPPYRSESLDNFFKQLLEPLTPEEVHDLKSSKVALLDDSQPSGLVSEVEDLLSRKKFTKYSSLNGVNTNTTLSNQLSVPRESRHDQASDLPDEDTWQKIFKSFSWNQFSHFVKEAAKKKKRYTLNISNEEERQIPILVNNMLRKERNGSKENTNTWQEIESPDGQIYFYNPITNERVWEKPEELKTPSEKLFFGSWKQYNFKDGTKFFYNSETKESTWKIPGSYGPFNNKFLHNEKENVNTDVFPWGQKIPENKTIIPTKGVPRDVLVKTALVCVREALDALNVPTIPKPEVSHLTQSTLINHALTHIVEAQSALSASISSVAFGKDIFFPWAESNHSQYLEEKDTFSIS